MYRLSWEFICVPAARQNNMISSVLLGNTIYNIAAIFRCQNMFKYFLRFYDLGKSKLSTRDFPRYIPHINNQIYCFV